MAYSKEFRQNIKEYYGLLDVFKKEINFDDLLKKDKLNFWKELCNHDYNEEENSCGNFERLKEFIILKLSKEKLVKLEYNLKIKGRTKKEENRKISLLKWRIFNG